MGTTRAFYLIRNHEIIKDNLQNNLKHFEKKTNEKQSSNYNLFLKLAENADLKEKEESVFQNMISLISDKAEVIIGYNEASKWLPLFGDHLCEGYSSSTKDTDFISELFKTDVLAFSIFDSDVLFISYSRYADKMSINIAKPNYDGYEEYDSELYSSEFPRFLMEYCPEPQHQKLIDIWESQDYVFADDRMLEICELINAKVIYTAEDLSEGFEKISSRS